MDFFDEDYENFEISDWLPYWGLIAACAKIKADIEAKGYRLEMTEEFFSDDLYLKIRNAEPWNWPTYHLGIYYVQKKDMLGVSVELFWQDKQEISSIIFDALREFDVPFADYEDDLRDMFIIPLHKVRELIDEYQVRKNSAYLYPKIPSHRKLEPQLILEIEKIKRAGELWEMSFEVQQFAKELNERFGSRLHDFINRHLTQTLVSPSGDQETIKS